MKRTVSAISLFFLWTVCLTSPGYAASTMYWAPGNVIGGVGTWNTTGAANWSTASGGGGTLANWVNANGDSASFGGAASYAVTVGTAAANILTVNKIFDINAGGQVSMANGSAGQLIFSGAGSGVDVASGGYFNISVKFNGTITKTGAGRLDIANVSTMTGKWILNAGYLTMATLSRLGTGTGSDLITFDGGGLGISTSVAQTFTATQGITVKAGGAFFGASASANTFVIASPILDGSGGTGNGGLNVVNGAPFVSPYASGAQVFLANASWATTPNAYKGPTSVASNCGIKLQAGTAGVNNQIPDDSVLTLTTGASVDFNGYAETVKSFSSPSAGTLNLTGGTLILDNPNGELGGTALIKANGGVAGASKVVMTQGTWTTPSGACDYDGGFTLNGGTLYIAGNTALGTGKCTINGGTRIATQNSGTGRTISVAVDLGTDMTFGQSGRGSLTFQTGAWTLKGGDRQFTADTTQTTISSVIGEDVAGRKLTKAGSGILVLSGANTYTGGTEVSAGTLTLGAAGSVKGNVVVSGSGVLRAANNAGMEATATLTLPASPAADTVRIDTGTSMTINALYFGAIQKAQGTWGSTASAAQHKSTVFNTLGTGLLSVTTGGANPTVGLGDITPVCEGSQVNLTATVSGGDSPLGDVEFFDDATSLGTAPLLGGTATKSVSLSVGTHANVTAKYLGDDNNNQSTSGAKSAAVNAAATASAIGGPTSVSIGQMGSVYSATPANGASTYAWTLPSGAAISGPSTGSSITVNWGTASSGSIFVTETTSAGCVGSPVSLAVTVGPNHAPVGGSHTVTTRTNLAINVSANKLKAGDSDPDNDPLSVTAVSGPQPSGASVSLSSGVITYDPGAAAAGPGSFKYTLEDGQGGTALVTVSVTITDSSSGGASPNLVYGPALDGSEFVARFAGIPGEPYTIESSASPTGPWVWKSNVTAPTDNSLGFGVGVFEIRQPTSESNSGYYRTVYPAY